MQSRRQQGAQEPLRDVVVSLSGRCIDDAALRERVLRRLRRAGLDVRKNLVSIGVVTGAVAESKRDSLRSLPEVVAVENDQVRVAAE